MPRRVVRLTFAIVICAVAVALLGLTSAPAAAATTLLSVSASLDASGEIDSYGIALEAGMQIQVEAVCGTPNTVDPWVDLFDPANNYVASDDDSGPVLCGGWRSSLFTYSVAVSGYYWLDVGDFGKVGPYTLTVTLLNPIAGVFSGPGLPGPDGRNLVLFTTDTPVLSAPDGVPTGNVMKACQTAFVITTSEDAAWGQLFVMGGWVPLANTLDVPEDYGQNAANDAALVPGCVNALPYPPVYQPPAPTPTRPVGPNEPPPNGGV